MEYNPLQFEKRLKELYPQVDESVTPLPRRWSSKDKYTHLNLQQDGLKVLYAGQGKNHKDAGSVRATHPIPIACGLYYYEIKVISKGRDGYLGIGLSAQGTNLNRLPGWEKLTYGYHGDDGHKFFSTGNGQPYGPTYTTGDVIGCCLNLISYSCFYTKNGIHIGDAFHNLPTMSLFPTVGLQTPNEELIANFGQRPFEFDFADYVKEWRIATENMIYKHVYKDEQLSNTLNELVQQYLVHHGYVGSIEAFHNSIGDSLIQQESLTSIKNRQRIKQLVLNGQIGEAIECTDELFPGILSSNSTLLFSLKVRQFIEMVNGTDSEVEGLCSNWESNNHVKSSSNNLNSKACSTPHHVHSIKSNLEYHPLPPSEPMHVESSSKFESGQNDDGVLSDDNEMETDAAVVVKHTTNGVTNGVSGQNNSTKVSNGVGDYDKNKSSSKLCGGNPDAVQRMVEFGQQLLLLLDGIKSKNVHQKNKDMLLEAYSLLAYTDPWSSPVGYQLDPIQREPVFASLNSAILKSQDLPTKPPIQTLIGQTKLCLKKMLSHKIGTAAFVSVSDYLS